MDDTTSTDTFKERSTWRPTLAEFIATLLFVFLGAGSVVANGTMTAGDVNPTVAIALAHGLAIVILVYATAHISGGHINPAVTLAMVLTKRMSVSTGSMYIVGQLLGGVIGALLLKLAVPGAVEGNLGAHALAPGVTVSMGVLIEVVLTFVLVFVVFATAIDSRGRGSLAPLAIGFAVLVDHLVGVPLTGASMESRAQLRPGAAGRCVGRPLGVLGRTARWCRGRRASLPLHIHGPASRRRAVASPPPSGEG